MATGEQLKALLKSHTAGDDDLFRSVALQIAAHEATKGNDRLAQELRDLVAKARRGLSHAEVVRACDDAARGAVMSRQGLVSHERLAIALKNRGGMRPSRRRKKTQE